MIITVDAGNALDKIQHPFIIKTLTQLCTEEKYRKTGFEHNNDHP